MLFVRSVLFAVLLLFPFSTGIAFAENIDPDSDGSQFAYGENIGWLNAEPGGDGGPGIEVQASMLKGYLWAENVGWVSLACENTDSCATVDFGVDRASDGRLSGYGWSENTGWISFSCSNTDSCEDGVDYGVTISPSSGEFEGYAWGENIGWVHFKSDGQPSYVVKTAFVSVGTIIVEKQTVPDGALDSFSFSGDAAGDIADGEQIIVSGLLPGTYTSEETVPAGWSLTAVVCDDDNSSGDVGSATATFHLAAGENIKCTFTNSVKTGACCYADKVCAVESEADCASGGGVYHGHDSTCDPNPCDDGDGVPDEAEDDGPNGGDGNGDGKPDSAQSGVCTLPNPAGGYFTLEIGSQECAQILKATAYTESDMPTQDIFFDYSIGLLGFEMDCPVATIRIYYHDRTLAEVQGNTYRKYGPTPDNWGASVWYTLPGVAYGTKSIGGQEVPYSEFTVTDGGWGDSIPGDEKITDPGGIAKSIGSGILQAGTQGVPVPAITPHAVILLATLLGGIGYLAIRRREQV